MAVVTERIPHIYGAVLSVENHSGGFSILMSHNGGLAELLMPPLALDSVKDIKKDDRILIDLEHWAAHGMAYVSVCTKTNPDLKILSHRTSFTIGKDACKLIIGTDGSAAGD